VAYWLLTGGLVFDEKGAAAMMLAHLRKEPIPPSKRSEITIPASLDRAVLMCLAKEPSGRPDTAEVLARMLENAGDTGAWTPADAESWWQANIPESHFAPRPDRSEEPETLLPERLSASW
jgi:serine/threonine-protein kinase